MYFQPSMKQTFFEASLIGILRLRKSRKGIQETRRSEMHSHDSTIHSPNAQTRHSEQLNKSNEIHTSVIYTLDFMTWRLVVKVYVEFFHVATTWRNSTNFKGVWGAFHVKWIVRETWERYGNGKFLSPSTSRQTHIVRAVHNAIQLWEVGEEVRATREQEKLQYFSNCQRHTSSVERPSKI